MNYDQYFDELHNRWYVSYHPSSGNCIFTRKDSNTIRCLEMGYVIEKFQYEVIFKQMKGKKGKIYLLDDFYYHTIEEVIDELIKIGIK